MVIPGKCFMLLHQEAEVRAVAVGRALLSKVIHMRFSALCILCAAAAAAVAAEHNDRKHVEGVSEGKREDPLTEGRQQLRAPPKEEGQRTLGAEEAARGIEEKVHRNALLTEKQSRQSTSQQPHSSSKHRKKEPKDGRRVRGSRTRRSTSAGSARVAPSHAVARSSEKRLEGSSRGKQKRDRKKKSERAEVEGNAGANLKAKDNAMEEQEEREGDRIIVSGQGHSQKFIAGQDMDFEHGKSEKGAPASVGPAPQTHIGKEGGGPTEDAGAGLATRKIRTGAFDDIPMTREQRLELFLDYFFSPKQDAAQQDTEGDSASRTPGTRTTSTTSGSPRRRETSSTKRQALKGGKIGETTHLLAAARRSSSSPPREATRKTFTMHRAHAAVGAALLATVAVIAKAQGAEDAGWVPVNPKAHPPQFHAIKKWADAHRPASGRNVGQLDMNDVG